MRLIGGGGEEQSSPSCGAVLMYCEKPSGAKPKFGVKSMLTVAVMHDLEKDYHPSQAFNNNN